MKRPEITSLLNLINQLTIRHLTWIERITRTSPRLVVVTSLLLVLLSLLSLLNIRFETDIFRLFPADRPAMRLLLDSLEWSGGAREAYFLLEGDPAVLPGGGGAAGRAAAQPAGGWRAGLQAGGLPHL